MRRPLVTSVNSPIVALLFAAFVLRVNSFRHDSAQSLQTAEGGESVGKCKVANPFFNTSGAKKACKLCVSSEDCKWCPLSQTCVTSGWLFGDSCEARDGHPEDEKIKAEEDCGTHTAPWVKVMNDAYGPDWPSKRRQHLDAIRCIQWGLNWPVESDSGFESDTTADEIGRWGCVSALLRDGLLAALGFKHLPTQERSSLLEAGSQANASAGRPWWYYERESWTPALCDIIRPKLKKVEEDTCYVRAWQVDAFRRLIEAVGSPNGKDTNVLGKLRASLEAGPLVPLEPGAGKSGSGFGTLGDGKYKVKLGLKYKHSMNEPHNLMGLVKDPEGSEPLLEHYRRHPESLLNRFYSMLKIAFGEMRSYSVLMDDAFYHMDGAAEAKLNGGGVVRSTRYDLKGASRNQKEKKESGFCLVNGDFKAREAARMVLTGEQCLSFRSAIAADSKMLQAHSIIDYSILLLSVDERPVDISGLQISSTPGGDKPLTCATTPGEPFCIERGNHLYTVSIIDYFNDYNSYKAMESIFVKWGKFWQYGKQVEVYAKKICPTEDELRFKMKLNELVRKNSGSVKDAFKEFDTDNSGTISKDELAAFFAKLGLSEAEAHRIHEDLDDAEDGSLSFDAFSYLFD